MAAPAVQEMSKPLDTAPTNKSLIFDLYHDVLRLSEGALDFVVRARGKQLSAVLKLDCYSGSSVLFPLRRIVEDMEETRGTGASARHYLAPLARDVLKHIPKDLSKFSEVGDTLKFLGCEQAVFESYVALLGVLRSDMEEFAAGCARDSTVTAVEVLLPKARTALEELHCYAGHMALVVNKHLKVHIPSELADKQTRTEMHRANAALDAFEHDTRVGNPLHYERVRPLLARNYACTEDVSAAVAEMLQMMEAYIAGHEESEKSVMSRSRVYQDRVDMLYDCTLRHKH